MSGYTIPAWWDAKLIIGFEESNEDGSSDDANNSLTEDDDGSNEETFTAEEVAGLKSSLFKERENNKALRKQLKAAKTSSPVPTEPNGEGEGETTQLKGQLTKAENNLKGLADYVKQLKVNSEITKLASELKFIDPEDAVLQVDRSAFAVEQDEENPANIEVDLMELKKALKTLSTKKPHLIATAPNNQPPSGGSFRKPPSNSGTDEETLLRNRYSAL